MLVAAPVALVLGIVLAGDVGVVLRNLGLGVLGGFVAGFLVRRLFVVTMVVLGVAVALAWSLAAAGVLPGYVHPRELVLAGYTWLVHETLMLERLAMHVLPVSIAAVCGLAIGARR